MSRLRRALKLSFAAEYTTQLMSFVSVMILARLLTPEEIGIFSLAFAIIIIAQELRSFGVGPFLIQEKELTRDKIRSAIGILFLTSWTIAVTLMAVSALIARYYEEPGLRGVMIVLACNFVVMPFDGATHAYFVRELAFDKVFRVKLSVTIVHVSVVLSLAFLGFGYMSMAWAALAGAITSVLILNYYRPSHVPFLPGFREFKRIFSFGSFASGAGILRQLGQAVPELVVGRMLSMEAVGYFSRAMGLINIFQRTVLNGVQPVMLPHFSEIRRGGEPGAESYLKAVSLLTCLAWPFYGFLALMAYPVTRILYGEQWDAAVPVAQVLCLWGAFEALFAFTLQILFACGAVKSVFLREAILVPLRGLLVIAGIHYGGLVGVAVALGFMGFLELIVSSYLVRRALGVRLRDVIRAAGKSIPIAAWTLIIPTAVVLLMDIGPSDLWGPFLVALFGAAGGWLLGIYSTKHHIRHEVTSAWDRLRTKLPARHPG